MRSVYLFPFPSRPAVEDRELALALEVNCGKYRLMAGRHPGARVDLHAQVPNHDRDSRVVADAEEVALLAAESKVRGGIFNSSMVDLLPAPIAVFRTRLDNCFGDSLKLRRLRAVLRAAAGSNGPGTFAPTTILGCDRPSQTAR